jgi:hypothetical protein
MDAASIGVGGSWVSSVSDHEDFVAEGCNVKGSREPLNGA